MNTFNIITLDKVDSTNRYCKDHIEELNHFDVVFSLNQTSGKGRNDRIWYSSLDSLTMSIVIKDDYLIDNFSSLSLLSASSVFNGLSKYLKNLSIKWPNDIYCGDKKISGILLESISFDRIIGLVIGIGININNRDIIVNDRLTTSLFLETNKLYSIEEIREEILNEFYKLIIDFKNGNKKYLEIVRDNNYLKGKIGHVNINNTYVEAKILNILDNNKLLVEYNNSTFQIDTDEINIK